MAALIRIGALAARTGVSTHLLRVWEERYGLLEPERTPSGYRLYGPEAERRVRAMLRLRDRGVSPAQAAVQVLATDVGINALDELVPQLFTALTDYDDAAAGAIIGPALAGNDIEDVIGRLFYPCLRWIGEAWAAGQITIGQEHFASIAIRRRMMERLGAEEVSDPGRHAPRAVLACPPHERHDIGLLGAGLMLRSLGWRITFLGAETPVLAALQTAEALGARLLLFGGTQHPAFAAQLDRCAAELARRPAQLLLAIGGEAATASLAARHQAIRLDDDPGRGARQVTARAQAVGV